jgi:Phosphotransferase enzyme family
MLKQLETRLRMALIARRHRISVDTIRKVLQQAAGPDPDHRNHFLYANLGGASNSGTFLHYKSGSTSPFALSKVQQRSLAQREHRFMQWSDQAECNLAARCYGLRSLDESTSVLCSAFLQQPDCHDVPAVHALHTRLLSAYSQIATLDSEQNLRSQIQPDSPIREILHHVVTEPDPDHVNDYLEEYFSKRAADYSWGDAGRFLRLITPMVDSWAEIHSHDKGLIHGDFKKQNILAASFGDYRLIDHQYYTVGIRTWDLAFFYHKRDRKGFDVALRDFREGVRSHPGPSERLFCMLYLVAACMRIKREHLQATMKLKIGPVIQHLESLERSKQPLL